MKGTILDVNAGAGTGLIAGDDGKRYTFASAEWRGQTLGQAGQKVDFEAQDDTSTATAVFPDRAASADDSSKKIVAGLLALFLGGLGIHKFYLGYTKEGVIMLVVFLLGFILLTIPSVVIGVIAFIEGIIYLTRSNADFERIYVTGRKPWF